MNPVHLGHIDIMNSAKTKLEAEGYTVLGGWVSASHEKYVKPKAKSFGQHYMEST